MPTPSPELARLLLAWQEQRRLGNPDAVARLQHINIVQVFDVGDHDGKPYFALEFCEGGTLAGKLAGTPLPAREAAELVEKLARQSNM